MYFFCYETVYNYFREYLDTLILDPEQDILILWKPTDKINVSLRQNTFIFVSCVPTCKINFTNESDRVKNIVFLNTEQLTSSNIRKHIDKQMENISRFIRNVLKIREPEKHPDIYFADYSYVNIQIMKTLNTEIKPDNVFYLPYQYCEKEINKLKDFLKENNNIYDIAFCGSDSLRRNTLLRKLARKYKVQRIRGFGDERDKEIAKAKILLNVHFNDTFKIFESIRCDRWIMAGMHVISEVSLKEDNVCDFSQDITCMDMTSLENITDITGAFLDEKKIKEKIQERHKLYLAFREKFDFH